MWSMGDVYGYVKPRFCLVLVNLPSMEIQALLAPFFPIIVQLAVQLGMIIGYDVYGQHCIVCTAMK